MVREVFVDEKECTGCEWCVNELSAVFEMTPDRVSRVHDSNGASGDEIQRVIDNCPAECIHWKI